MERIVSPESVGHGNLSALTGKGILEK